MGNQNGNGFNYSNQTGLYIHIDKPFYFSGEEVVGNIYLNVRGGEQPKSTIYLKVKGSEKAKWTETRTVWEDVPGTKPLQRQSRIVKEHYDNENEFYLHKIPVYKFQQETIPQGQYQFPFTFKLKENLPGSFEYQEENLECRIRYSVKAEIDSPNNEEKIKYKQEFLVREPIKDSIKQKQKLRPTSCCCIPLGTIEFRFQFKQSSYQPQDIAQLEIEIDNTQSKVDISTITGRLINTLTVVSKSGHTKLIPRTYGTSQIPGILAGQSALNDQIQIMTSILMDQDRNITLNPTTNGKVVMNNYYLFVSGELKGIFLCNKITPEQQIPIRIVAQPIPSNDQLVVPPPGWKPQVMDTFYVQFEDSYKYYPKYFVPVQNQNTEGYQNQYYPLSG